MTKPRIGDQEFARRVEKTQTAMRNDGLDLLLCFGNEAEPQFVRYYSDYWPSFESAGVLIPVEGKPLLIIGPESGTFAAGMSRIKDIRQLLAFRESSEPEYPGAKLDSFSSIFQEAAAGKAIKKVGLAGYSLMPHVIFQELEAVLKQMGAEIVKADLLVSKQRVIKSADELACMREAYRIAQVAMRKVVETIRPGMTENQVKGVALAAIYEEGGEGESYPFWVLAGSDSNQAIGRCRGKVIQPGDMVQVQVGARYEGYASTVGRPIIVGGKATSAQKALVEAALAAQKAILAAAKPGGNAKAVSDAHLETLDKLGFKDHVLYGPCHGSGLMEGEYPWIESNSDYLLEPGMTFCTCVYLGNDAERVGIRVEDGFMITDKGTELFSNYRQELIEV